jgi:hypothetical protein
MLAMCKVGNVSHSALAQECFKNTLRVDVLDHYNCSCACGEAPSNKTIRCVS